MPPDNSRLASGAIIEQEGSQARARLGLLVVDHDDRVFGLTANHAVMNENALICARVSNHPIGYKVAFRTSTGAARPMFESIAWFEIDENVALDGTRAALNFASPIEMQYLMGRRVRKFNSPIDQATITALYGTIELIPPLGGPSTLYCDTIEIRADVPERFLEPGDAGALMLTDEPEPRPIGLLVARAESRLFLAPLFELMRALRFKLLTETDAINRNMKPLQKALAHQPASEIVRHDLTTPKRTTIPPKGKQQVSALSRRLVDV